MGDGLHVERLYPLDTGTSGLRVRAASPLFEYSHGISYIYWAGPSAVYLILVRTAFVQDFLREIASNIEEVGNRLIALIFWIQSTSL